MTHFRTPPTYTNPLTDKDGNTNKVLYRWMRDTESGLPPSSEVMITPSASPYTYTAPSKGQVIITGGAVSALSLSRTPGVFHSLGITTGAVSVNLNDQVKVVFSSIPMMVFFPQ
jgi:hypothetical protein